MTTLRTFVLQVWCLFWICLGFAFGIVLAPFLYGAAAADELLDDVLDEAAQKRREKAKRRGVS